MIPRYITLAYRVLLAPWIFVLLTGACVSDEFNYKDELQPVPPKETSEALKSFQIADGFRIELAAAEPLVVDPVAIAFDADGRLFVIEMRGYSEDDGEVLGRVRLLEDLDDNGTYEKSTIFAEGFSWPTAIYCTQGGILVGAAPNIFLLKDTDSDGKADQRRVVFTGFNKSNVQGLLNTFKWGLDNRIHGVTSSSGGNVHKVVDGQPVGKSIALRGRDFSIDPLTMQINAISGGGQHGMSMNSWGEKFTCSNSDHLQQIVFEDRYLARNPYLSVSAVRRSIAEDGPQAEVFRTSPVEAWRVIRTKLRAAKIVPGIVEGGGRPAGYFTGATGVTLFRGDSWPESSYQVAIIGDVGSNLIHRKRLIENGVAYRGKRIDEEKEFVSSSDIWFRPVQYANAPDGSLYVADMYREVIEHPKSLPPMIKKHLDLTSGRDRGRIYRILPTDYQRQAVPRMSGMKTEKLVTFLNHPNAWHRETAARLIYERQDSTILPQLRDIASTASLPEGRVISLSALAGLGQLSPQILLSAIKDLHPRVRQHAVRLAEPFLQESPQLRKQLIDLTEDPSKHVRFQLALSSGFLPDDSKVEVLSKLAISDGTDPDIRVALQSSLTKNAGEILARLAMDSQASEELIGSLARQVGKQQRAEDITSIAKLLSDISNDFPDRSELILTQLDIAQGSPLAQQLADATNGKSDVVIQNMIAQARLTLLNHEASLDSRIQAIAVLRFGEFDSETFHSLLQPSQASAVQKAALNVMQTFEDRQVASLIIARWQSMAPDTRSIAGEVLSSRAAWIGLLLDAIDDERIRTSELNLTRLAELKPILSDKRAQQIDSILLRPGSSDRAKLIKEYSAALTIDGDATKGRQVFNKHCTVCHQLNGEGHAIGPNLVAMKNRGSEAILVNILNPNAEVNPQYMNYVCLTIDGRTVSGIITNETSTSIKK